MYIGNIVTKDKILDEKYNICEDITQINDNFITLIIGWGLVKDIYGEENVSILNKKIDDKTYWTFDSKERKVDLEIDLENFPKKCVEYINHNLNYIFVDVLHDTTTKLKKIIKKIYSLENIISFFNDKMVYIFDENLIFGLDLNILEFVGLDINKIKHKIINISEITLRENEIFNKCIRCVENNNEKTIPYIYRYGTTNKDNHISIVCRR
jgi:hypothetical protein